MAVIVVTGATGFIGGHLARRLHALGHAVRATGRDDRALARLRADGLDAVRADLGADPLEMLFANADVLVHAAALSSPWGPRADFIAANVHATERVLAAARRAGVRRVVHFSSPSLYFQMRDRERIGEDFTPPRRWITAYAESKWLGEEAVRAACADGAMTAAILRPRAVFGDGDRAIFPRLIAVARRGRFPLVNGGRAVIDVTHVDNVVDAAVQAIDAALPQRACAFNVSNGEPMPVRALLDTLYAALGLEVRYVPLPRPLAMTLARVVETLARLHPRRPEPAISRYTLGVLAYSQTLDIGAARRVLGYAPRVGVREGILRFARDWRA